MAEFTSLCDLDSPHRISPKTTREARVSFSGPERLAFMLSYFEQGPLYNAFNFDLGAEGRTSGGSSPTAQSQPTRSG
jgi:hypothetical protein